MVISNRCYEEWKEGNSKLLKGFSQKDILMLYSGGKDSSFAMELVLRAGEEFGFGFKVIAGAFPRHRYPDSEKDKLGTYWRERGTDIIWLDLPETDEAIRSAENPCTMCRGIRKKFLKGIVAEVERIEELVIVVNYNLWDLVGYSLERILGDILTGSRRAGGGDISRRFWETAQRFHPFVKMKEGYSVFRPVLQYNGNYIDSQLEAMKIPVLSIPCAYRNNRPKKVFEAYYNKMGLSFNYADVFNFAEKALDLPPLSRYLSIDKEEYLGKIF
ncbi:MAG: hypothetical protein JW882_07405 [Deltaproteobacteria bacterium]|nr:hypothetical protein [Deltaproteobacteria bacterium]